MKLKKAEFFFPIFSLHDISMIMKFTPEAGHETGIRKVLMKNEQFSYKKAGLCKGKEISFERFQSSREVIYG